MLPVRDSVDGLGIRLADAGAPLSSSQADQLTQIFANATTSYQHGGMARGNLIYDWDQTKVQAAAVLTPEQRAVFQQQIAPAVASRQLRNAIREAGGFGEMQKV